MLDDDNLVYEKIIYGRSLNDFTPEEKDNAIYLNYNSLLIYISKSKKSFDDFFNAFRSLTIVQIDLGDENAQEIFESLNSTGRSLKISDVLRNHLFMRLDYPLQIEMYEKYWKRIEVQVGKENLDDFLQIYAIYKLKTQDVTNKSVFFKLKGYFIDMNQENCLEYFDDLYTFSKYYSCYYNNSTHFSIPNLSNLDKEVHEISLWLRIKSMILVYMFLRESIDNDLISIELSEKCIRILVNYCVRNFCIINGSFANNQYLITLLNRWIELRDNNKLNTYETVTQLLIMLKNLKGNYRYPSDSDILNSIEIVPMYGNKRQLIALGLLERIEKSYSGKESSVSDSITIEHIMPQSLTSLWKNHLGEDIKRYKQYLHTLGNLTLTGHNEELSNKIITEKVKIYRNSSFYINRGIAKNNVWKIKQIRDRSRELCMTILSIYNDMLIDIEIDDNDILSESLDSDNLMSGNRTNISKIKIGDYPFEEVKNMRDALIKVLSYLIGEYGYDILKDQEPLNNSFYDDEDYAREHLIESFEVLLNNKKYYIEKSLMFTMFENLYTMKTLVASIGEKASYLRFIIKD